jgi:hypothetical protein
VAQSNILKAAVMPAHMPAAIPLATPYANSLFFKLFENIIAADLSPYALAYFTKYRTAAAPIPPINAVIIALIAPPTNQFGKEIPPSVYCISSSVIATQFLGIINAPSYVILFRPFSHLRRDQFKVRLMPLLAAMYTFHLRCCCTAWLAMLRNVVPTTHRAMLRKCL